MTWSSIAVPSHVSVSAKISISFDTKLDIDGALFLAEQTFKQHMINGVDRALLDNDLFLLMM